MAMHTASGGNNTRCRTLRAYAAFEDAFGHPPFTNIMHGRNRENIYWGKAMPNSRVLSRGISLFEPQEFLGHVEGSAYFWGDICREKTRYVRGFETLRTDTLAFDPATPYHDATKPNVNWWFSSSNGAGVRLYGLLSPSKRDSMRRHRGACIIHFYARAYSRGEGRRATVDPRFAELMRSLHACHDGWYVPVVSLLDRLRAVRGVRLHRLGSVLRIESPSGVALDDVALHVPVGVSVWDEHGTRLSDHRNEHGQVPLGDLCGERLLWVDSDSVGVNASSPIAPVPNYWRLAAGTSLRIASEYRHGRRGRVNSPGARHPRL